MPSLVLFPRDTVPLHIYELRYRAMVRDVLRADRLIAMALLKPGWELDYHGSPAFHAVGCLAHLGEVEWKLNDDYEVRVTGLSRIRFGPVCREYPYRSAKVTLLPQEPLSDDDPLVELECRALLAACRRWMVGPMRFKAPPEMPEGGLERLVSMVSSLLMMSPEERLALLELDSILERSRRVRDQVEQRLRGSGPGREGGNN